MDMMGKSKSGLLRSTLSSPVSSLGAAQSGAVVASVWRWAGPERWLVQRLLQAGRNGVQGQSRGPKPRWEKAVDIMLWVRSVAMAGWAVSLSDHGACWATSLPWPTCPVLEKPLLNTTIFKAR